MIINEELLYRALHQQPLRQLTLKTSNHVINVQTVTKKKKTFFELLLWEYIDSFLTKWTKKTNKKEDNRYFTCISESHTVSYNL